MGVQGRGISYRTSLQKPQSFIDTRGQVGREEGAAVFIQGDPSWQLTLTWRHSFLVSEEGEHVPVRETESCSVITRHLVRSGRSCYQIPF